MRQKAGDINDQPPAIPRQLFTLVLLVVICSCAVPGLQLPARTSAITGSSFYKAAASYNWKQRDSFALKEILAGNLPAFLGKLVPVHIISTDSLTGEILTATIYVSPDYLAVGTNEDWARIPLTPMVSQQIADSFDCFLPTRKISDAIYHAASLKLEPMPMYAFRDSTPTMYQHHLIIEGLRKERKGLIAGIKKDVVISGRMTRDARSNRVAIYGWHLLTGKAIQPLYTGHVNWYVDYSHGTRLVYRKMKVNGKWMDYREVMEHPLYKRLICDEEYCDFYTYPY